jgi:hypothetical protein
MSPVSARLRHELQNIEDVCLGNGRHFLQEDDPHDIGALIADWYRRLPDSSGKTVRQPVSSRCDTDAD